MHLQVALVQLDARGDVAANIATAVELTEVAAAGGARLVAAKSYRLHRTADVCHERVHAGQGITLGALLGWLKLLRRRSRSPQLVPCRARRPTSITGQGDRRINFSAIGPTRMLQACSL